MQVVSQFRLLEMDWISRLIRDPDSSIVVDLKGGRLAPDGRLDALASDSFDVGVIA